MRMRRRCFIQDIVPLFQLSSEARVYIAFNEPRAANRETCKNFAVDVDPTLLRRSCSGKAIYTGASALYHIPKPLPAKYAPITIATSPPEVYHVGVLN